MDARVATDSDLDGTTELLTDAFMTDPVWAWALPDRSGLAAWWRFNISSALRHNWVWVLGDFAAVAMWIPPGATELSPEEEAEVEPMIEDLAGPRAPEVMALLEQFEAARPEAPPHYYLSLLGSDPARRGNGYGMTLLDLTLAKIDAEGMPAYLESSNPSNDARYERRGFRRFGEFERPDGGHTVAKMWREAA
jgi:GNAT superfamily N-acetyltransferase